jgi:sulfatase maturation enzyme AslB (radical SAM superfamily)
MPLLDYDLEPREGAAAPRLRARVDLGLPCNLRCDGCARCRQRGRPSRAALTAVAERTASLVEETGAGAVSLVVFGGEPLLDLDAVLATSMRVRDACERRGCAYDAAVITNATLLDGPAARRLARAGVGVLQVTVPAQQRPPGSERAREDVQQLARIIRNVREAHDDVDLVIRCEVNGTDDLRDALSTVRVLEREGVLAPPRPAAVVLAPRASYAAQATALFSSPAVRHAAGHPMPMIR